MSEEEITRLRIRVAELEDRLDFLYKRLKIEYNENPNSIDPRIIELIKGRNKIGAIKIYRELHNTGLAEAKSAIDDLEAKLGL